MKPNGTLPRLVFPDGFSERDEWEMERKGYVHAFLEVADGGRFPVLFMDPVRLAQDIEATLQSGQPGFYELGLVVVPEVTVQAITRIIPHLADEGYLERHLPVRTPVVGSPHTPNGVSEPSVKSA